MKWWNKRKALRLAAAIRNGDDSAAPELRRLVIRGKVSFQEVGITFEEVERAAQRFKQNLPYRR